MPLEIFVIVFNEEDQQFGTTDTKYSTRLDKAAVISLILDYQKDRNIKIDRIFSVDEFGKRIKKYDIVLHNFRIGLEEVTE